MRITATVGAARRTATTVSNIFDRACTLIAAKAKLYAGINDKAKAKHVRPKEEKTLVQKFCSPNNKKNRSKTSLGIGNSSGLFFTAASIAHMPMITAKARSG